jgi:hypothetical protein
MATPKQLLLEHRYDGHLATDINAMLTATPPRSWRQIAADVSEKTGCKVSHESLRQWYGHEAGEPHARSA